MRQSISPDLLDRRTNFIRRGGFGQHPVGTALVSADQFVFLVTCGDDDDADGAYTGLQTCR